MIHLLVSNKHIQCIKWDHENGKPFLSSFSYVPFKSKKLSQNPTDKELVNEINTTLQLQKKRFSFEGEQVYVTIPDDFCSSCVIYPEGTWYTLPDDDEGLERILEHLRGGDVAEDFVIGD